MSSTAPATSPPAATSMYGTRNQVGSGSAKSPSGFAELDSPVPLLASSTPKVISTIGPMLQPSSVQPTTPRELERRGR
jgi:hypothetical protein